MDKTILDFTEATEFAADDWVLFDSESGGGCRIKATKIAPVVTGIDVTYTQTHTVYADTPLDDLKQDLIVKAVYRRGREKTVEDYTLSGTLSVGTSNITVSYHGYDEIIQVTVSSNYIYEWDLTDSLTDKIRTVTFDNSGCTFTRGTGVSFPAEFNYIITSDLPIKITNGMTMEIDVGATSLSPSTTGEFSYFMRADSASNSIIWSRYSTKWLVYASSTEVSYIQTSNNINVFSGKTLKIVLNSETDLKMYADDDLIYHGNSFFNQSFTEIKNLQFGAWPYSIKNLLLTGIRIYNT